MPQSPAPLRDLATLVVVPREKFSFAERSLHSMLANTPDDVPIVYVDAGRGDAIRRSLEAAAATRSVTYARVPRFISPNAARALAFAHVRTPYVAFADNDVFFEPGWLEALVAYARARGAAMVGPLTLIDVMGETSVHLTGGDTRIVEENGRRVCLERQYDAGLPPDEGRKRLSGPTEMVEFHAMLARCDFLRRAGGFDTRLLSVNEHADLCVRATALGEEVGFCAEAVVTYAVTDRLTPEDRAYYRLRWSEAWNARSARRFERVQNLDPAGSELVIGFARVHRQRGLRVAPRSADTPAVARRRRVLRGIERVTNTEYSRLFGELLRTDGRDASVRRLSGNGARGD